MWCPSYYHYYTFHFRITSSVLLKACSIFTRDKKTYGIYALARASSVLKYIRSMDVCSISDVNLLWDYWAVCILSTGSLSIFWTVQIWYIFLCIYCVYCIVLIVKFCKLQWSRNTQLTIYLYTKALIITLAFTNNSRSLEWRGERPSI